MEVGQVRQRRLSDDIVDQLGTMILEGTLKAGERLPAERVLAEHARLTGQHELARVHHEVTERIRIIRRLDFLKQMRIDATYDEHAKILRAIIARKADRAELLLRSHIQASQVEVRKITLHQVYLARK